MIPFPSHLLEFECEGEDFTPLFLTHGQNADMHDAIVIVHCGGENALIAMNEQMMRDYDVSIRLKKIPGTV